MPVRPSVCQSVTLKDTFVLHFFIFLFTRSSFKTSSFIIFAFFFWIVKILLWFPSFVAVVVFLMFWSSLFRHRPPSEVRRTTVVNKCAVVVVVAKSDTHTHTRAHENKFAQKTQFAVCERNYGGKESARHSASIVHSFTVRTVDWLCVMRSDKYNTRYDDDAQCNAIHDVPCDTQQLWKEFWANDDDNNRQLHANKNDNNKQSFSSTPHEKCKKAEEEELTATLAATCTKCDEIKNTLLRSYGRRSTS